MRQPVIRRPPFTRAHLQSGDLHGTGNCGRRTLTSATEPLRRCTLPLVRLRAPPSPGGNGDTMQIRPALDGGLRGRISAYDYRPPLGHENYSGLRLHSNGSSDERSTTHLATMVPAKKARSWPPLATVPARTHELFLG